MFHLRCREALWQRGMCPLPEWGHCGFQARAECTTEHEEAQEPTYRRGEYLPAPARADRGFLTDKGRNRLCGYGVPLHVSGLTTGVKQALGNGEIIFLRRHGGAKDVGEVVFIALQPVVASRRSGRRQAGSAMTPHCRKSRNRWGKPSAS